MNHLTRKFANFLLAASVALGSFLSAVHVHSPSEGCAHFDQCHAAEASASTCGDHDHATSSTSQRSEDRSSITAYESCDLCELLATYNLELSNDSYQGICLSTSDAVLTTAARPPVSSPGNYFGRGPPCC